MAKKLSLADEILGRAKNAVRAVPWFEKLPADDLADLESVRAAWQSGSTGLTRAALSRTIIETLRSRGLPVSGVQGVGDWLSQRSRA